MAINSPGGVGKFRGKIDNVVLYSYKKLHIGRSTPKKSYKKPSKVQLEQRSKMKILSPFASQLTIAIQAGYPSNRSNMSAFNAATRHNIKHAITGTFPDYKIDYAQIQMSKGSLSHVYNPTACVIENSSHIKISWENAVNLKIGVEEHDRVQFCIYGNERDDDDKDYYKGEFIDDAGFRGNKETVIKIRRQFANITHLWMFLISADGKRASATRYLGKYILP